LRLFVLVSVFTVIHRAGTAQAWIQWSAGAGGNDHYYALTPFATNWNAAQQLAVSCGGTLATITSSNEQNFINANFLVGAFEHRPLWIGLIAPKNPVSQALRRLRNWINFQPILSFRWVTGEPLSYANWKSGEPSNTPSGENYVAINWEYSDKPPRGIKGDWNDTPLNGTSGYGGKTDGPYFGLIERDTDPSLPQKIGFIKTGIDLGVIALLLAVLMFCLNHLRRNTRRPDIH
jgi:hypothetical protein